MKKSIKKLLASVVICTMVFSLFGITVLADDSDGPAYVYTDDYSGPEFIYGNGTGSGDQESGYTFDTDDVYVDGNESYPDVPSYMDSGAVDIGHHDDSADLVVNAGNITVENSEELNGLNIYDSSEKGDLTVNTGTIDSSAYGAEIRVSGDGKAEVNIEDINSAYTGVNAVNYGGDVNITTGDVTSDGETQTGENPKRDAAVVIKSDEDGSITFESGSLTGNNGLISQAGENFERSSDGEVTAVVNGDVTANDGTGVEIANKSADSKSDITVNGDVVGTDIGAMVNYSAGKVDLNVDGSISASEEGGIGLGIAYDYYGGSSDDFITIDDPEDYDCIELDFSEDDENPFFTDDAGNKIYVFWEEDGFYDQDGNPLNVGRYYDEDDEEEYWYVILGDLPEPSGDINVSVSGDIKGGAAGILVGGAFPMIDDEPVKSGILSDILVEGTISADQAGVVLVGGTSVDDVNITVWKIETDGSVGARWEDPESGPEEGIKEDEKIEGSIKYIIKLEQPEEGATLSATDEKGNDLAVSHDYEIAYEGDKVLLKVELEEGYKVLAAYNGLGEKTELLMDSDGNYYVVVPKGGGVYLSVELEKEKYNVTFVNEDGSELQSGEVEYGEIPAYNGEEPTKEGNVQFSYEFSGWSPEIDKVTGDITYTAVFKEVVNSYDLTFDLDGGTLDSKTGTITISCEYGSTIKLPGAPTKEGNKFLFWKGSEYEAGASYTVEGPHSFIAAWEEVDDEDEDDDEDDEDDEDDDDEDADDDDEDADDDDDDVDKDSKNSNHSEKTLPPKDNNPRTADDSNTALWIVLLGASIVELIVLALKRKMKNN